jgi:peptidoglycan-associated lipoprotein
MLTLTVLAGCGKKSPRGLPPAPIDSGQAGADSGSPYGTGSIGDAQLEALRRDFIARSGSDTVYFGTDSHVLDSGSRATLDAQAAWLLAHPSVSITIEGHCDERGTREYNLGLGERRANAAKNYLAARGVPAGRMTTISWGKERPLAEGSSEAAWAQNRRAVTVLPAGS